MKMTRIQLINEAKKLTNEDFENAIKFICETTEIDEGLKDTLKNVWEALKNAVSTPVDAMKKVLSKDRELIDKTEENLKMLPKDKIAAVYSYEFAEANVIDDLIDMMSMFKDILLLRYKHIPWRTALAACALLAYILCPYNLKAGSILTKYLAKAAKGAAKGAAAVGILGGSGIVGNTMGLATLFMKKTPAIQAVSDPGITWSQAWKEINNADFSPEMAKAIEPYLNCLDELCIIYLLWKWFRKDLKAYRTWLVAKDYAKQDLNLNEGEGGAAGGDGGAATGGEAVSSGTSTTDVLGEFDPSKGFMGKGDFHIPKRISVPFHRWECCNGGSKRKKGKNGKDKMYYTDKGTKVVYDNLNEEEKDNAFTLDFVYNIPYSKVPEIIDQSETNNTRFDRSQLTKYIQREYEDDAPECIGVFKRFPQQCLAMAFLSYDAAHCNDCYIREIQCFQKGFGKVLLKEILAKQENVWLMADMRGSESLLNYYRQPEFKLKEYVILDSVYECPLHFFYTKDIDEDKLTGYLDAYYANDEGEETLDESKNKLTKNAEVIKQKSHSLKANTVEKAKRISAIKTTPVKETTHEISNHISKVSSKKTPLVNKLKSRESRMQSKHTERAKQIKDFFKPDFVMKKMSFPRNEIKNLRGKDQIITSRVSDEYDRYQIGDIVKTSFGDTYKVVSRMTITDVKDHPYHDELTDKQLEILKKYDKIAVLSLNKFMQKD